MSIRGKMEHRMIWEWYNKAVLLPWADVHHKNGDRLDNRIENLEALMHASHGAYHAIKQHINAKSHYTKCYFCGIGRTKRNNITRGPSGWLRYRYLCRAPWNSEFSLCPNCLNKYRKRLRGLENKTSVRLIKPMIKLEKLIITH